MLKSMTKCMCIHVRCLAYLFQQIVPADIPSGLQKHLQEDNDVSPLVAQDQKSKTLINAKERIFNLIPIFTCCILEALTKLWNLSKAAS
jgi:hypothetical protein